MNLKYLNINRSNRVRFCDKVARIRHTGWFCDNAQCRIARGVVISLPHGRYLSGLTTGDSMRRGFVPHEESSYAVEPELLTDETTAAHRSDQLAERYAEAERDYNEREAAEFETQRLHELSEERHWAALTAV